MPTALPVPINPSVLQWARKESGYEIERIAERLQVKPDRVEAWERGERSPTLRQIQELARFLHRPLNVLFLPSPPQLAPLAAEYRRLPGVSPGSESPQLRLAVRQMVSRRETALSLMEELAQPVPAFPLQAHLEDSPENVGRRVRATLGLTVEAQFAFRDEWHGWREWRAAVERNGLLVFQFPKVDLAEARGLSLLRFPLAVIGVNSHEQPESRIYTLLHEFIHLMLAAGNEERSAIQERRSEEEWAAVERFAEAAASYALIPEDSLRAVISAPAREWEIAAVRQLAVRFRVTPLAMATRLRVSGFMDWAQYRAWNEKWNQYVAALPPRSKGFAHPIDLALGRSGRPYVRLVLEALAANRITAVEASRHLNLRFEHFEKLKRSLWEPHTGGGDE